MFQIQNNFSFLELSCYTKGLLSREHGTLYLSEHYVCFHARVFGSENKYVIPISQIVNLSANGHSVTIKSKKKKVITFSKKKKKKAIEI